MRTSTIELQGECFEHRADGYIEYIRTVKARSANTISAYLGDLNCFSRYLSLVRANCSILTKGCITEYLTYLRQTLLLKPATIRRRMLTLQSFCEWLVAGDFLKNSPFNELSLDLKVPKRLPRPVDPLTIRQLLLERSSRSCGEMQNTSLWTSSSRFSQNQTTLLVVQLMLTTGIRVGEAASMRVLDVSTDGSTIHIIGKGDKERLVYVENKQLATSVSQYRSERESNCGSLEALFVNSRGKPLTPQVIRKRLKLMCKDVGAFESPTPHRFRHSAATLLIEGGADIRVVQRLLGHASISTTELYTQVTDVSLRQTIRKADVLKQFQ